MFNFAIVQQSPTNGKIENQKKERNRKSGQKKD